ncbi:MAG: thioredoxin [Candidatus Margulisiibacteriota bacterium]|jgi:thioredoxin 1
MIFTKDNFEAEVLNSDKPVLIDFFAEWCGPCRMLGPVIEKVAQELAEKVKIGKVNSDNDQELAVKYEVASIPCVVLIKDGIEVARFVGYKSETDLKSWINSKI